MAITKELIDGLLVTIQNLYLADDIPWMIGYSGGKDSTAAVQLVWLAIEQLPEADRKKQIIIMNTDTLVESPVVSKWVEKSLEAMKDESTKKKLPFVPERLTPKSDDTFWVNLIGRGYPFPRMKFRWCTARLKIDPVNTFIKEKIAEHGELILVLGTRKQESTRRNRTMTNLEKKRVGGLGNYEMATSNILDKDDKKALAQLINSSILMTEHIYNLMRSTIETYDKLKEPRSIKWPTEINRLKKLDFSVLFVEDFPNVNSPCIMDKSEYNFLGDVSELSLTEIRDIFSETKCYLWLKDVLTDLNIPSESD